MFDDLDELQRRLDARPPQSSRELDMQQVARLCQLAGFPPLAFGGGRVALFFSPETVAKLAWRPAGHAANRVEAALWENAPDELRPLLCPIVDVSPGGAVLMLRCLPAKAEHLPGAGEVITALSRWGVLDSPVNLGLTGGGVVCYDYATLAVARHRQLGLG